MKLTRWQPPAYAPVAMAAVWRALWNSDDTTDPRDVLAAQLCQRFAADVAHLTSSGTTALQVAIRLARVGAGEGPVALPAYGCFDLATAAIGAGAPIALYDLDPDTLAPDLDSLTAVLAAGARVVVVAPIMGIPVPWEDIVRCATAFGAVVVEDAAQGHGGRWRDQPLGAWGGLSVLSFGRGKGWTGGRGGAVLVRDRVLSAFSRGLPLPQPTQRVEASTLAVAAALAILSEPSRYGFVARMPWLHLGETRYHDPSPLSGMTRSAAALLLASQGDADAEAAMRRTNARTLLDAIVERSAAKPIQILDAARPGYLRLPVRTRAASRVVEELGGARLGAARGYPSTLAELPAVRAVLRSSGPLPGANALVREIVTLPTHSQTTHQERHALVRLITSARRLTPTPASDLRPLATSAQNVT